MITNKKLNSAALKSAALILFLILFSSTASAATTTCNVKGTSYQYWSGEQYPLIDLFGEQYVSLLEENDQIWESHVDKISKLVIDNKDSYSLTAGENLDLGQGYSLQIKQVDVDGQKVWIEFDKDGQYVDDQIISTDSGDQTWNCTHYNIQGIDNGTVLKVHVNQIISGTTDGIVQIDGIWLIDYENTMTLHIGNQFGNCTLKEIVNGTNEYNLGSLVFDNGIPITDLGTLGESSYAKRINDKGQVIGESNMGTGHYEVHAFLWQNGVMTDLGTLGGDNSEVVDINENGQIVGYSDTENGERHAFLWQNGVMTDLGTLGGSYSWTEGINDKGQIVGTSVTGTGDYHAFLWQNGVMTDLGTLGGMLDDMYSSASGINENGQIVGQSDIRFGVNHAFLWQNGVMTDLGTLGGSFSEVVDINENGQIVGYSDTEDGERHAFLWQNGVMTDLGMLGEFDRYVDINENGQIVGDNDRDPSELSEYHAFLWQSGVMTDLGTLGGDNSYAIGINGNGQIVGDSDTGNHASGPDGPDPDDIHAFLWQNGVMTDLGTLGGRISCAYGINDKRQIVGQSETENGEIHAVLWTVATPSTNPVANFSASPASGYVPLTVNFTDQSTNSPSAWNWSFGDGTTSTDQNPTHTYSTAGNYTVTLTASNAAGSSTATGIINVTPSGEFEDIVSEVKVSDNRLREASPDTVYKTSTFIDVGGMSKLRYRDVVQFNLSKYSSDSQISNAVLSLYWYYPAGKTRPNDTVIEIYRPASSWNSDYVSWNKRDKGIAWTNAGGDWYDKNGDLQGSTPYATITVKGSSIPDNKYYNLDVTDLVKEYVSGKYENTGILIKARTENNNYIAFYSNDWTNENQRPKITVTEKVPVVTITGATDNRLREESPDSVYSDSSFIDIGGMNNLRYRDVIRFDLNEYNGDTPIENAALSLYWYYPAGKTRSKDTIVEVYRPASAWNSSYVSWNKRDKGVAWKNPGGDWYDKNGVLQGSTPYATITIKGSTLPDNKYYKLDVTDLVKEYTSGKYENTGFLIKARTESDNYIAFYSSDCGNENQVPKLQLA
ncbi:MAG: hypothetical protein QG610_1716 [Euryarchaeota archaeon]|nr:hypothetical protein [Euryarchaeota archaeon]